MRGARSLAEDLPPDVLIGLICARLNKLPSEVEDEDVFKLLRTWQIVRVYDRIANKPS